MYAGMLQHKQQQANKHNNNMHAQQLLSVSVARCYYVRCDHTMCWFSVQGASGAMAIVKQALPYVRAVGASFPLSRVGAQDTASPHTIISEHIVTENCPAQSAQTLVG